MAFESPFKNMKITSYYRYLLVLFGIAFLISLVYEVKGYESKEIQRLCLWIIGASSFIWILEEGLIRTVNTYLFESYIKGNSGLVGGKKDQMKYDRQALILTIINVIIQLSIWIYVFWNIRSYL
jgi:hypothetical protein